MRFLWSKEPLLFIMGWTSYHADSYKTNGQIDRKKECQKYFLGEFNKGFYRIEKDTMVGNVYYAAVTALKSYSYDTNSYEDIPIEEQDTFAVVILTSVNRKDYMNFSYKIMDETMGPCEYDCYGLLKYLSPIESEFANKWREEVKRRHDNQTKLKKFPVGTKIKYRDKVLTKTKVYSNKAPLWLTELYTYVPQKKIINFELLR